MISARFPEHYAALYQMCKRRANGSSWADRNNHRGH